MKAILIDPFARTVTDVEWDGTFDTDQGAYKLLDTNIIEVVYLTRPTTTDVLFVDEEGTFKEGQHGFITGLWTSQPLLGKTLVTGDANEAGDAMPATLTRDEVEASITWLGQLT